MQVCDICLVLVVLDFMAGESKWQNSAQYSQSLSIIMWFSVSNVLPYYKNCCLWRILITLVFLAAKFIPVPQLFPGPPTNCNSAASLLSEIVPFLPLFSALSTSNIVSENIFSAVQCPFALLSVVWKRVKFNLHRVAYWYFILTTYVWFNTKDITCIVFVNSECTFINMYKMAA